MQEIEIIHYKASLGLGVIFPVKTFIIKETDHIAIISPCDLPADIIETLKQDNRDLIFIAPNNFHNGHIKKMKMTFPNAQFYGPKRSARVSGVELKNTKELKLKDTDIYFILGNNSLSESCFFHKPTSTLIVTDLLFNMSHKMNISTKIMMKLVGTYKRIATSRMVRASIKDKELFNTSIQTLINLAPKKVIPSHGNEFSFKELELWAKKIMR
jgi:hypothetical protein